MFIDFHTHGKLAKNLPFSEKYTNWLFTEAQQAGLDALCLTEHFNTLGFEEIYQYISKHATKKGDTFIFKGLSIFPGMETDIAEGGHILTIGSMETILELNKALEPHKKRDSFLSFNELMDLFEQYPVIIGAAHPFREGGHIPELSDEQLSRFHFIDLNGKDVAEDRKRIEKLSYQLGRKLGIPVVSGSDTHQAVQYGCIGTKFYKDITTVRELYQQMYQKAYEICISDYIGVQVKTAVMLKRALKEIHTLGGDYVAVLTEKGTTENER